MERLDPLQKSLAKTATRRARAIAHRYAKKHPEYAEDIESAAYWGAIQAASRYNHNVPGTWRRWSGFFINMAVLEFLRTSWVRRTRLLDDDELKQLIETASEDEDHEEVDIKPLLRGLPVTHMKLCSLVYLQGLSLAEAGKKLGMKPERAYRVHSEAIKRIRDNHEHDQADF